MQKMMFWIVVILVAGTGLFPAGMISAIKL
jgi:hypothetical protein